MVKCQNTSINRYQENKSQLTITAQNEKLYLPTLHQWLHIKAKSHLTDKLTSLSEQTGLRFNKVTIRCQKSRWGSCSAKKNIKLHVECDF